MSPNTTNPFLLQNFAEAMEIVPYTLAENAGLNPIGTVIELRNRSERSNNCSLQCPAPILKPHLSLAPIFKPFSLQLALKPQC